MGSCSVHDEWSWSGTSTNWPLSDSILDAKPRAAPSVPVRCVAEIAPPARGPSEGRWTSDAMSVYPQYRDALNHSRVTPIPQPCPQSHDQHPNASSTLPDMGSNASSTPPDMGGGRGVFWYTSSATIACQARNPPGRLPLHTPGLCTLRRGGKLPDEQCFSSGDFPDIW